MTDRFAILVRHGAYNQKPDTPSALQPYGLTDAGKVQAQELGAEIADIARQEGIRLARAADAKMLAIFHHDPDHEDGLMEQLEAESRTVWPGAIVARENMRINLL